MKKDVKKENGKKLTAPAPKPKITVTLVGERKFTPNIGGKSVTQKRTPIGFKPTAKKMTPAAKDKARIADKKVSTAKKSPSVAAKAAGVVGKVAGAASKVASRVKTTAREARDIPTAVGTIVRATADGNKGLRKEYAVAELKKQVKETTRAAKTGLKGSPAPQYGKNKYNNR